MGAYLDTPITEKNPEYGKNEMVAWGLCSMQGWRCGMEDAHIAIKIDLPKSKT
jgi:protein phosphatase 1B